MSVFRVAFLSMVLVIALSVHGQAAQTQWQSNLLDSHELAFAFVLAYSSAGSNEELRDWEDQWVWPYIGTTVQSTISAVRYVVGVAAVNPTKDDPSRLAHCIEHADPQKQSTMLQQDLVSVLEAILDKRMTAALGFYKLTELLQRTIAWDAAISTLKVK